MKRRFAPFLLLAAGCLGLPELPTGTTPDMSAADKDSASDQDSAVVTDMQTRDDSSSDAGQLDAGDLGTAGPTWLQVSAGGDHACALEAGGDIYCWGDNYAGQLGLGNNNVTTKPTLIPRPVSRWDAVAAGMSHTCAVGDGDVYCWGANGDNQVADEAGNKTEPTLKTFGIDEEFAVGADAAVGAGVSHSCALRTDGTLRCWGPQDERIGNSTGTVVDNTGEAELLTVALGDLFGCGIATGSDSLLCWGAVVGFSAPTPYKVGTAQYTAVSVGVEHACAVTTEGNVECFGSNTAYELSYDTHKLGHTDAGEDQSPREVNGIQGATATAIAAGVDHTCAVTGASGQVSCWGYNSRGETGQDGTGPQAMPKQVEGLEGVTALTAGDKFTCAIADGSLYCWGSNENGTLGRGTVANPLSTAYPTPLPVQFP